MEIEQKLEPELESQIRQSIGQDYLVIIGICRKSLLKRKF